MVTNQNQERKNRGGIIMKKSIIQTVDDLLHEFRARIKIGSIVSVYDPKHPEYFQELFFVIGFQQDMDGNEMIAALMDKEFKTFLVHIESIILKDLLTIDDMFPPELVTFYESLTSEVHNEV